MLYDLINQADIISIDGMILVQASLHPKNGLEGTAHSNTDSGATYHYKITIENLQLAILNNDAWHVSYLHNNECNNAIIQCFSTQLMKPENMGD